MPPFPLPEDQTKAIFEGAHVEHVPERDLLLQLLPSHEEDRVDEGEQDADRRRRHDSDQAQILDDINIADDEDLKKGDARGRISMFLN